MKFTRFWSVVLSFSILNFCQGQSKVALRDILDGNVSTFSSAGHPKSKGAVFTMKYPSSWKIREGARPNVVQDIEYSNGKETATVVIITKSLPDSYKPTRKEVEEILSPAALKSSIPDKATFVSGLSTEIEGDPAGILEYTMLSDRAGSSFKMHMFSMTFFQGNTMVQVQFSVGSLLTEANGLNASASEWKPVFQAMMNSIVFPEKWK